MENDNPPVDTNLHKLQETELKDGTKVTLFAAKDLKNAPEDLIEKLAASIIEVNPSMKIDKIKDQMSNGSFDLYYVEQDGGPMAGYATVFPDESSDTKSCYLNKVYTKDGMTQKGVARKLIEQVMADYDRVALINTIDEELPERQGMEQMYLSLGFKTEDNFGFEWTKNS